MSDFGEPAYRGKQLYEWFHKRGVSNYAEMTNLSSSLRVKLAEAYPLNVVDQKSALESTDGSKKYLIELNDGLVVETVGMPSADKAGSSKRLTVCVSSQVGCPMGCTFCATGNAGFSRNLTETEIVDQVLVAQKDFAAPVSNIVVMGQGEPFLNYDNVLAALRRFNTDEGIMVGARKITVSTVGIIEGIKKFATEPEQFRLAVSLHAAKQKTRDELMPHCYSYPLTDLAEALIEYNHRSGRRVTLEYMLIDGVNDSDSDMDALAAFCDGINCHVNLIPMNEVEHSSLRNSSKEKVNRWVKGLSSVGIVCSIRDSRGSDVAGACGQLANKQ